MIALTHQGIRLVGSRGLGDAPTNAPTPDESFTDKAIGWLKTYWYVPVAAIAALVFLRRR
jgi:hypothetical protein